MLDAGDGSPIGAPTLKLKHRPSQVRDIVCVPKGRPDNLVRGNSFTTQLGVVSRGSSQQGRRKVGVGRGQRGKEIPAQASYHVSRFGTSIGVNVIRPPAAQVVLALAVDAGYQNLVRVVGVVNITMTQAVYC